VHRVRRRQLRLGLLLRCCPWPTPPNLVLCDADDGVRWMKTSQGKLQATPASNLVTRSPPIDTEKAGTDTYCVLLLLPPRSQAWMQAVHGFYLI
jgi:hypothetical protein